MKKRVLMVSCEGLGNGGVQNVMMNIIRNLSDEYHFDMLLFTKKRRYFDDEMEKYGSIYRIPHKTSRIDYFIRLPRIFFGTYRLLKIEKYGVIHCNNDYESGICLLAAFFAGVKIRIVHVHRKFGCEKENVVRKTLNAFYKFLLNICSTCRISCSKEAGESIFFKIFNIVVNSIDLKIFDATRGKKKKGSSINFIHVGMFCQLKNQIFIVRTVAEIRKTIPDVHLTLVGFGDEYKQQIVEKIEEFNMNDVVDFLPSNADIPMALANSDYMIFPSRQEGLGIALLEAQAMGVYCFASKGVPPEADAGLCEFLDLNIGHEMWAKRIVECIQNEEKKSYAQNIDKYSLETMCVKIRAVYEGEI